MSVVEVSIPSVFGLKKREGISICYNDSPIGEFVIEEDAASEIVARVTSRVRSEKTRMEQEEQDRRQAEEKKAQEKMAAMRQHNELQEKLEALKAQLDRFPPEMQNSPQVLELRRQYEQLRTGIDGGFSQYEEYLRQQEAHERERKTDY